MIQGGTLPILRDYFRKRPQLPAEQSGHTINPRYMRTRQFQVPISGAFETGLTDFHKVSFTSIKLCFEYKTWKIMTNLIPNPIHKL